MGIVSASNSLLEWYTTRYEAFPARCCLAALDHNCHVARDKAQHQTTRQLRFHRKCNKSSGQLTVAVGRVYQECKYIPELLKQVILMRMSETSRSADLRTRPPSLPLFISPTIALVLPCSTAELVKKQQIRISKNDEFDTLLNENAQKIYLTI